MRKSELIKKIKETLNYNKENSDIVCTIEKVYGLAKGVGYDILVEVFGVGKDYTYLKLRIKAHAMADSWALVGHLRPNNSYYEYTGKNDGYQSAVKAFWQNNFERAFDEYLSRIKKVELEEFLETLTIKLGNKSTTSWG